MKTPAHTPKPHEKILHGLCHVCGHHGDDCLGYPPPKHKPSYEDLLSSLKRMVSDGDWYARHEAFRLIKRAEAQPSNDIPGMIGTRGKGGAL